ncbi:MAG: type I restriction endonuclease subunit R [Lentisphaerae bacterium]|nr:type I restriction endonuclease subunit R [Lentisphaerota bacterium]
MAYTDINSEDRLVQATFAGHLRDRLGWETAYAWNAEGFGAPPAGPRPRLVGEVAAGAPVLLGRQSPREAVLTWDLRTALARLNPHLPASALADAAATLTRHDISRTLMQHNQEFHGYIRDGVPVRYRDAQGQWRDARARIIDFQNGTGADGQPNNRFLAVRELKLTGLRTPNYNRRADLVCFVNGLPLVFIELKAIYRDIRAGFDGNLRDYLDEHVIAHAFHHNALLVVSNGHEARYGSITSQWEHFAEWKRLDERDQGSVAAEVLLNGMLAHDRLLDLVENFVLFDSSKPGATRKIVARNHQVLGVNAAVQSVCYQEELKRQYPPERRLSYRVIELSPRESTNEELPEHGPAAGLAEPARTVELVEAVHPDLGKLGVFWHTQGSGKSYSMAFFAEKVRRRVSARFTFVLMTDRDDLDSQIYRTFIGCGVADESTPRAASGEDLKRILQGNHRYVFSLIHKFNQDVDPKAPYSTRDDLIVISDEAHRTQAGKLARNMRLALPNAAFIGFTGTPLFQHDHLTRRIFGSYVSRYDFKRSEEDGATTRLVYENRGEKLGLARLDLNDRIAEAVARAELDPDKEALIEKLLGQDYEVITADDRLDRIADDFVEHCAARWESGKCMLVCIDKITCGRMYQRIAPRWQGKLAALQAQVWAGEAQLQAATDDDQRAEVHRALTRLRGQAAWMADTLIQIIVSEGQGEVADFARWGVDIIPHRALMKRGFEVTDPSTGQAQSLDVDTAFKDPQHPFRVAIVCAMWLTGFDVECLSTLYIDKPMKAHTLMQAIARANRVYPGKDFGLIVDYNGVLKSLRAALAQYALGDDDGAAGEDVLEPLEDRVRAFLEAIEATELHLRGLGFEPGRLQGLTGFARIQALADGAEAVAGSCGEDRRRFGILARLVFARSRALAMEPAAFTYAERHDTIEAIYKRLNERRDAADVTELLQELQRIVNEAIRAQIPDGTATEDGAGRYYDLSRVDLRRLRDEFANQVRRKATVLADIAQIVEARLEQMLARNPARMDYYKRYQEIIADYNREKDRVTIETTFARLMDLMQGLDAEQRRAAEEGLSEAELALFDLLTKPELSKRDRERVKQASQSLLAAVRDAIAPLERWTEKEQTKAIVQTGILDHVFALLPAPLYTPDEKQAVAARVYQHVWEQSVAGRLAGDAAA